MCEKGTLEGKRVTELERKLETEGTDNGRERRVYKDETMTDI